MKRKEIEKYLNTAVSNSVPDVLDNILEKCEKRKGFKNKVIKMKTEEKKKVFNYKLIGGLCCLILVLGLAGIFGFNQYNKSFKVETVIEFDVNPSIELKVNRDEEVIEALALNDDAKKVLSGMDLNKVDLNVAVNAIIGSMMKNGYLTIDQNSILVSVKNNDSKERERLQKEIMEEINNLLNASSINGSVLTQEFDDTDKNIEKLSDDYNISIGKAKLISNVLAAKLTNSKGELYTFDALAGLSITELNLLLNEKNTDVEAVNSSGTASTSAYIGRDKAKEIALNDAKVKESNIRELEIEFDADDGILLYEVEFKNNNREYEYDIDAKTGKILYKENDIDDDYVSSSSINNGTGSNASTSNSSSSSTISRDKAKSIALNDAKAKESSIRELEIELDKDDGRMLYEIEFKAGNKEYQYEINAVTGKIIERDIEIDD